MKLNAHALGLAFGIFAGVIWFLWMLVSLQTGFAKDLLALVGSAHPWYSYSYGGALWMGVLHLICGYIGGYVVAWLYNKVDKK